MHPRQCAALATRHYAPICGRTCRREFLRGTGRRAGHVASGVCGRAANTRHILPRDGKIPSSFEIHKSPGLISRGSKGNARNTPVVIHASQQAAHLLSTDVTLRIVVQHTLHDGLVQRGRSDFADVKAFCIDTCARRRECHLAFDDPMHGLRCESSARELRIAFQHRIEPFGSGLGNWVRRWIRLFGLLAADCLLFFCRVRRSIPLQPANKATPRTIARPIRLV